MRQKDYFEKSALKVTFFIVSAFLALRLVTSLFPDTRLWGFNHGTFIQGMPLLYPILFLIGFILYQRGLKQAGSRVIKNYRLHLLFSNTLLISCLLVIVSGGAFYILSAESHYLGDGYQLISYLSQPQLALKPESFGEMKIHQLLAQWLGSGKPSDVYLSFKHISIFSGLIFVISLLHYGRKIAGSVSGYYAFVLLNFLSASAILFFGYVETYSAVTAILFLYFLSALASMRNKRKSIIPLVTYPVAVFLHKISLIFLPTVVFYILLTFCGSGMRRSLEQKTKPITISLIIFSLVAYIAVQVAAPLGIKKIFLPPLPDRFTTDGYTLFSFSHMIDLLNLLLFLAPLAVIAVIMLKTRVARKGTEYVRAPNLLLRCATTVGLLAAFLIEPKLGMARDWDLMTTMLIGVQITGILFWIDRFEKSARFGPTSMLLILLCLSIFVPWLAIHNSPDALHRYGVSVMKLDPKHTRSGLIVMLDILKSHGKLREAEDIRKFCSTNLQEDIFLRRAEKHLAQGNHERADGYYRKAIAENPGYYFSYFSLARSQIETNQLEKAFDNLRISDALNPYNSENSYYSGVLFSKMKDTGRALEYWRKSIHYDASYQPSYISMAEYFLGSGQIDSATRYYTLFPNADNISSVEHNYRLGLLGLKLGDTAKALNFLGKYSASGSDSLIIDNIEKIKKKMEQY